MYTISYVQIFTISLYTRNNNNNNNHEINK